MVGFLKPVIERRLDDDVSLGAVARKEAAVDICGFLEQYPKDNNGNMRLKRERFYHACESLLSNKDSERILLYLPLWALEGAPASFKRVCLDAWYDLLGVMDVRENFHKGDCFELDARPSGGLERVVKCAHLTPWLIKFGYIGPHHILSILEMGGDDVVLLQSFKDTWGYIRSNKILSDEDMSLLTSKTAHVPERQKPQPLYISKKRLEWLEEQNQPAKLLTPNAKLEGPFSDNIPAITAQLEQIESQLAPSEIVLVGGSQLKGYGTTNSDLDVWHLEQLKASGDFAPGSPHAAHIYFNALWLGRQAVADELARVADQVASSYRKASPKIRHYAIERLDNEIKQTCQFLLHKKH